jgi:hypothetical protein
MKNIYILLPLLIVLLISACKKNEVIVEPEIPELEIKYPGDSISFTIAGKHYTNEPVNPRLTGGYSNRGTNIKRSAIDGDWAWYLGGEYWVGASDSVQYSSFSKTNLKNDEGNVTFEFAKVYPRNAMLYIGGFYLPRTEENYYKIGDYKYAVDFGREGKNEGVAIAISLKKSGLLTSYSQYLLNKKSRLTADSHLNSRFKIVNITEEKATDYIILEAEFEADLFDEKEVSIKVTHGYVRLRVLKFGYGRSILN